MGNCLNVVELGTNDAKAVFADRQEEVPKNLEKLILSIKNAVYTSIRSAKIIIIAPPPFAKKADTTVKYFGAASRVREMSRSFRKVAKRNGAYFVNGHESIGEKIETLSNDGIHLNPVASQILVEPVAELIKKLNSSSTFYLPNFPTIKGSQTSIQAVF